MASDAVVEGVSGAAGGIVALLATYPLMTISTMQATRQKSPQGAEPPSPLSPSPKGGNSQPLVVQKTPRGAFADILEAVKSVGVKGLYSGLQASVLGTAVSQGVYFYLYSLLRDAAVKRKHLLAGTQAGSGSLRQEELGIGASLAVAAAAGCGNVLLTNPIWVVATRMQSNKHKQADPLASSADMAKRVGPLSVAQEIFKYDGITGFWKGVLPSLVMVCNPTVQYVLFEWLLARIREARTKAGRKGSAVAPNGFQIFLIGALAKLGATVVTYPLLLIKSRLMSQSKTDAAEHQYSGTLDALLRIYKNDGLAGFYNGLRAKIVQSVLAAAILFYIREEVYLAVRAVLRVPTPIVKPPKLAE